MGLAFSVWRWQSNPKGVQIYGWNLIVCIKIVFCNDELKFYYDELKAQVIFIYF
jgi:hypothetical protein